MKYAVIVALVELPEEDFQGDDNGDEAILEESSLKDEPNSFDTLAEAVAVYNKFAAAPIIDFEDYLY